LSTASARGGNLCGSPSTGPIITENFNPLPPSAYQQELKLLRVFLKK